MNVIEARTEFWRMYEALEKVDVVSEDWGVGVCALVKHGRKLLHEGLMGAAEVLGPAFVELVKARFGNCT